MSEPIPASLLAAPAYGITARIGDPIAFAHRSRMLLLRHLASRIDIDLALGGLSFEQEALDAGQIHEIGGVRLRLPRVEDLLVMKAFASRPKDLQDIEGLLDMHPHADLNLVRGWLREFSRAAAKPDLIEDFEKIVARKRPTKDPS